jgi:hypothetical protein
MGRTNQKWYLEKHPVESFAAREAFVLAVVNATQSMPSAFAMTLFMAKSVRCSIVLASMRAD